jgi:uncharacterized damage-inducible protein DinB
MTTSMPSSATETAAGFPTGLTPAQLLYPDLRQELATTRRILERVPDDKLDFRPHDKSMTLGQLANHLTELSGLANTVLTTSELDFAARKYEPKKISTSVERLALFDTLSREFAESVEGADWSALQETWVLRMGEQIIVNDQKAKLLRTLGLSHMAHHRAQLGVYLRLVGVAVPGTYGPSADEM